MSQISQDKLQLLNDLLDKELENLSQPMDSKLSKFDSSQKDSFEMYINHSVKQYFLEIKFKTFLRNHPKCIRSYHKYKINCYTQKKTSHKHKQKPILFRTNIQQYNCLILFSQNEKKQYEVNESGDENTPLKKMYAQHQQKMPNSIERRIHFQDIDTTNEVQRIKGNKNSSPISTRVSHINHKSSGNLQRERVNKFDLERSIEQAEGKLKNSKQSLQKTHSKKESIKARSSSAKVRSKGTSYSSEAGVQDIQILNKKIQGMKRAQEEERSILQKEKQRNNLLISEIEQLNRKLKKLQVQVEKNTQLEVDYEKLLENFEKSEYIRVQQKNLIHNLKIEIESLKKQKVEQEPVREQKGQLSNQIKKKKKKIL